LWVPQKEPGQFKTSVARCSDDGDPSPAIVPATSFIRAASSAAASGCAPDGGVFKTSKLSDGRRSSRNSRSARSSGGSGEGSVPEFVKGL
jgi:hypothetical protein